MVLWKESMHAKSRNGTAILVLHHQRHETSEDEEVASPRYR